MSEIRIANKDGEQIQLPAMMRGNFLQNKMLEIRTDFSESVPRFYNSALSFGNKCRMRIVNARKVLANPDEQLYPEPKWFLQIIAFASFDDGKTYKLYCFTFSPQAVVDRFEELLSCVDLLANELVITLEKQKSKSSKYSYGCIEAEQVLLSSDELNSYAAALSPLSHLLNTFIDFSTGNIEVQNFSDDEA